MIIPSTLRVVRLLAVVAVLALPCAIAGGAEDSQAAPATSTTKMNATKLQITVGGKPFTATLEDNATVKALKVLLPIHLQMVELNGNEKYSRLSTQLPINAANPGTIQIGDLMIYGQDTLVLFYKTFPTSYSYTRVGRIDDTAGLAAALGSGDASVAYELSEKPKGN